MTAVRMTSLPQVERAFYGERMSYPPLPAAAEEFWAGAREALDVEDLPRATQLAAQAVAVTGWRGGYFMPTVLCGLHVGICTQLPVGWIYHEWSTATTYRWDQLLLIHPDASEFVLWSTGLENFMAALYTAGPGVQRIDPLLTAMVLAEVNLPVDTA